MIVSGYLMTGALTGLLSGLLGIGGGIIVVPALSALFLHNADIPNAYIMQMALGTSLAIMVITLLSGIYAHHRLGAVHWQMVKMTLPGLMIGAMCGAIIAHFLSSRDLSIFFSIFLLIMAIKFLCERQKVEDIVPKVQVSLRMMYIATGIIGMLASFSGTGGGILLVPFFLYAGLSMHEATATSLACSLGVALVGSFSLLAGMTSIYHLPQSTGYIYWPAFFGVAVMSVLFAPIGARMAHYIPGKWLKRILAIFLLLISIDMMLF